MNLFGNDPFPHLHSPYSQEANDEAGSQEKPKCPAAFFFGAGASKPAGVPTTVDFVGQFRDTLDKEKKFYFDNLKEIIAKHQKAKNNSKDDIVDIEIMLENLIRLEELEEDPLLWHLSPPTGELEDLRKLGISEDLKSFIKEKGIVGVEDTFFLKPLRNLITIFKSINIISTNYDIVVEQFCNSEKLSLEDGFGNVFEFERLKNNKSQIKLFKVHGSILWYKSGTGQFYKLPINTNSQVKTVFGEELEPLIIYPMRKWQYIEPTFEIINEAKRIMRDPDIKIIYVFGYSFRDDHILDIFLDVFRDNSSLYCVLVDPNAYSIYENRLKYNDKSKTSESSMAGRVICKPFTIQTELESFYAASMSPLIKSLNDLNEFWHNSARYGTMNWSDTAYLLLMNNYLSEFEKLRQNRGFLELEKGFWDRIRVVLIYIANQISAENYDKIFFSIDQLLVLLYNNFIVGLKIVPLVQEGQEKSYKMTIEFLGDHSKTERAITSYVLQEYKDSFINYWEWLRNKFDFSGINKKKADWRTKISFEILDLSKRIYELFGEVSGSRHRVNQPLSMSEIVEIMRGQLKEHKEERDLPKVKNNPIELVPLYLNIILKEFADNINSILSYEKKIPPDGLKWFQKMRTHLLKHNKGR